MENLTQDNTDSSTPRTRGSSRVTRRSAGIAPQRLQLGEKMPASTISSITTSAASRVGQVTRAECAEAIWRRNDIPLAELGEVPSPIAPWSELPAAIEFDPIAAENEYDTATYRENSGAANSEDEEEEDNGNGDPLSEIADREHGSGR